MNIQTFLVNILSFLNKTLLPFLIAMAALVFVWNIAKLFIIGAANPEDQEKARTLATWGIAAFVIIVSLWGIVNLLVDGFGFRGGYSTSQDYLCNKNYGGCVDGNR